MSEHDKGTILEQAAKLPPLLKARAEGFMQGLTAASADNGRSAQKPEEEHSTEKKGNRQDG